MREIKFRGKRLDNLNNNWVYGYLIIEPDGTCWIDHFPGGLRHTTEVIPETVGQFTGLKDKNGVDIYEGDLVMTLAYNWDTRYEIKRVELTSEIEYTDHGFWVKDEFFGHEGEGLWDWDNLEVIGTIHDKKE